MAALFFGLEIVTASSNPTISPDALVSASEQVVACQLAEGAALLDMTTNTYYSLNDVGAEIWSGLAAPKQVHQLSAIVRAKFDVGDADVESDILDVLADMDQAGLVSISHAPRS